MLEGNPMSFTRSSAFAMSLTSSLLAIVAMALAVSPAHAVIQVWKGTTSNQISTGSNYVSGVAPLTGDTAQWDGIQSGNLLLVSNLNTAGGIFLDLTANQTSSLTIDSSSTALRLRDITIAAGAGESMVS